MSKMKKEWKREFDLEKIMEELSKIHDMRKKITKFMKKSKRE